jgi:hypothetical protein
MAYKKLHPSVEEFKKFVTNNPKVLEEVRNGKASLQELYEDWYILGEEDERWDSLRSVKKTKQVDSGPNSDWLHQMLGAFKNMDPDQVQHYIGHVNQALGAVQNILGQFQSGVTNQQVNSSQQQRQDPFTFRKD